ncbi:MAG: bifunctional DNA-formamidopyrimidine glycosylase/DNA-(apurinic or apyrimidinic site) lyase [Gammaproteobacteria bacterium]|nr:MAG: bifunctional DNA-formamidopyrimidine glycosylase/DNA-(apurinic or apyrimidinic site) lyase [Gammaproteobacteria bacterium]
MPELPEVETTRLGIIDHIKGQTVKQVIVRDRRLRWPISDLIGRSLPGQVILDIRRRGKYLLIDTAAGTLIVHLGMSGNLHIVADNEPAKAHDHVDLLFSQGQCLRYNDPRRFGSMHWTEQPAEKHPLLSSLGPEPLSDAFQADYLYQQSRQRKTTVKNFIMDSHVVVGVGNIYASESLFLAGIHPLRPAGRISRHRYSVLVDAIRQVLLHALASGGSTLRDFIQPDGKPGYFQHHFHVYDKTGEPCEKCGKPIKRKKVGQRSTYYCGHCQH